MARNFKRGTAIGGMLMLTGAMWLMLAQAQSLNGPHANTNGNMNRGVLVVSNSNMNGSMRAATNLNFNGAVSFMMNSNTSSSADHSTQPSSGGTNMNANSDANDSLHDDETETPESRLSLRWTDLPQIYGMTNAKVIDFRSGADAGSAVVATLEAPFEPETVEILEATNEGLRVAHHAQSVESAPGRDIEGWVKWSEVVPSVFVLILDPQSGEVVRRVPLDWGITSVTFAPDGRRAIFHGPSASSAIEVDTNDYRFLRALKAGDQISIGAIIYDRAAGGILAPLITEKNDGRGSMWTLDLVRAGNGGTMDEATARPLQAMKADRFFVSGDGQTGFALSMGNAEMSDGAGKVKAVIHVVNLQTMQLGPAFELAESDEDFSAGDLAFNRDGSELCQLLNGERQRVVVIDTRTGARVREMSFNPAESRNWFFAQEHQPGESLLLSRWEPVNDGDNAVVRSAWFKDGKLTPAGEGIDRVVEAGSERYAVNNEGTRLFKLDGQNRVRSTRKIARPELKEEQGQSLGFYVHGFAASPDGKHLVVILAMPEDGC